MPGFHELTKVSKGQPVPDWRDIMKLTGPEHAKAISLAAETVWTWMHARAEHGDPAYKPATLRYYGGADKAAWHDGSQDADSESLTDGWRWDGVISASNEAYVSLWPSLAGKLSGKPDDPEGQLAGAFRGQVGSRLKHGRNVVCVVTGGGPSAKVTPQWFVSGRYNETAPPVPKKLKALDPGSPLQRITAAAEKLTPAEAGENKAPEPVKIMYACLDQGCDEGPFSSQQDRDRHAVTHQVNHSDAAVRCRDSRCDAVFTGGNQYNRRAHEIAVHPELVKTLYPVICPVAGCKDRFDTTRGLGQHLGTRGHGITDDKTRSDLINKALDKATRSDNHSEDNGIAQPGIMTEAAAMPQPAEPAVMAAATGDPVAAIQAVLDANKALREENKELRAELQQKTEAAVLSEQIRGLFAKGSI